MSPNPLTAILTIAAILAAAVMASAPSSAAAQWLQALREEAREPPVTTASPSPSNSAQAAPRGRNDSYDEDCDSGLGDWFGWGAIVTSPFWGPARLAQDDYSESCYFAPRPYHQDHPGLMIPERMIRSRKSEAYPMIARVRSEFGHDLNDMNLTRVQALFDTRSRFGIDGAVTYRHESIGAANDELLTGDFNLLFRFAQSPQLQVRAGAGVNWLSDDSGAEAGFNFTYSGDWHFAKPWVLSSELDAGSLGDSGLLHIRATIGAVIRGIECFTGYDRYDVDNLETNQWITGIGFWF